MPETPAATPTPTTYAAAVGATTRSQFRQSAERDAIEDGDASTSTHDTKSKDKNKEEAFKGSTEKMGGHVFQIPGESKKVNQFTHTIEALRPPRRPAPLFQNPH